MFGIKEEEPKNEEKNNEKEDKIKNLTNLAQNVENKDLKIIEVTINLSEKEKIKQKSAKPETKKVTIIKSNTKEKEEKKINNNEKDNKKDDNKEKPPVSLFGNFGSTSNNDNGEKETGAKDNKSPMSLFSNPGGVSLFGNNNNTSLFFGNNNNQSLFGNPTSKDNNSTPLFSNNNNNSNPFSLIQGESFLNSILSKKNTNDKSADNNKESLFDNNKDNDDDKDEDDENDKPKTQYIPEPLKSQNSEYSKFYTTHLNNLFLFNKNERKYISKGNGSFSFEKTKDENKKEHKVVVVYRNQGGNKLVEGFLDKAFGKIDIYNKDINCVVCFGILMIKEGNPEIGFIKIPFKNEENANELKDAFNQAIEFITT